MNKIALAIAGRHPGFQVFEKIDWIGPDPSDADIHTLVSESSSVYAVAQLDSTYDTYEYVIRNFVSSAARDEDFRLVMRLPHNQALLDSDFSPVLPTFVLREVFELILRARSLVLQGDYYRVPDGVMVPHFPVAEIEALLAKYRVVAAWNSYITMSEQGYNPAYIEAAENEIALRLNALLHCAPLQSASVVYFGRFRESVRPTYVFSDAEMRWQNTATARVTCRDGSVKTVQLGQQPVALSSDVFGYDRRVYETVSCQLSVPMVVDAYRRGYATLQNAAPNVMLNINPHEDAVNVAFRPRPIEKVFRVEVKRADNKEVPPFKKTDLLTTLGSTTFIPYNPAGYKQSGQEILDFERSIQDPAHLKSLFKLAECNFKLDNVTFAGDSIKVYVSYVEPKREPKAKKAPAAAEGVLNISVPRKMLGKGQAEREFVVLKFVVPGNNDAIEVLRDVNFVLDVPRDAYLASIALPSNLADKSNFMVQLGEIPKARVMATQQNGCYYANFGNTSDVHGAFSRFFSLFAWRYGLTLSWMDKLTRALVVLAVLLVIFLLGIGIGLWVGSNMHSITEPTRVIMQQEQAVETGSLQPEEPAMPLPESAPESRPENYDNEDKVEQDSIMEL